MSQPSSRRKNVLITGCSPGGIGHATATEFKLRGFHVIATARKPSILDGLKKEGFSTVQLDVTNEESIAASKAEVEKLTDGRLDILLNNAGIGVTLPATDTPLALIRSTYETNVFGPMALISTLVPFLINAQGLIINISSLSARVPFIFGSAYASSKAALEAYSRVLRAELRPLGVRVQCVMAGTVISNIDQMSRQHELPADSLYARVKHIWDFRVGFSQKREAGPIPTGVFARQLVDNAMKAEWPAILRTWLGRADWLYIGGGAPVYWWGSLFGEWVFDHWAWETFKFKEAAKYLQDDPKSVKTKST